MIKTDVLIAILMLLLMPLMFFSGFAFMFYVGYGAGGCKKESTNFLCSDFGLAISYITYVIFIIYIVMAPFEKIYRSILHSIMMIPWVLLFLFLIPQINDNKSKSLCMFIIFLYFLKYLCEPMVEVLMFNIKKMRLWNFLFKNHP